MNKKLLIANWKMNPETYHEAESLVNAIIHGIGGPSKRVVICPPFPWVDNFARSHKAVSWGAQDVFWENSGPYTGEVSPRMLKDAGVSYVIIGHSERRKYCGETDAMIHKKVHAALEAGLIPIICVGEWNRTTPSEAKKFIVEQLLKATKGVTNTIIKKTGLIIAYEPVWAISSQKGAEAVTPEYAREMILFIKEMLREKQNIENVVIVYGGSVHSENLAGFLRYNEIGGFLIGGASLIPREMEKMYTMTITNYK